MRQKVVRKKGLLLPICRYRRRHEAKKPCGDMHFAFFAPISGIEELTVRA